MLGPPEKKNGACETCTRYVAIDDCSVDLNHSDLESLHQRNSVTFDIVVRVICANSVMWYTYLSLWSPAGLSVTPDHSRYLASEELLVSVTAPLL